MNIELFNALAQKAGLTLDPAQHARLNSFLDLLLSANQRMNLTRITDRAQAEILHVADALTLLPHLPHGPHRLADVGSGGGIPGIILAIVRGDAQVVLIESTRKKADFLRAAAADLKLANVSVEPLRAEEVGRSGQRESFDVAVARAVALLPILVQWLLPLVKRGGCALAMKGPKGREELEQAHQAIKHLGGGTAVIVPADLPGASGHVIVKIPKASRTPSRYPRHPSRAGN
ncbi:MAG TPA: 16S rRNA (guanine(527)-N(7))-methyltransferase RsmG [Tepidisphaeraceae bacterium]|jgi:16S rRNA (guanine527-N7)-methyltransferase|nr:16S rRNA (guanine(527)-N(7))-methyltransferase RsmG [Tepidisphaeraceae bacterium]